MIGLGELFERFSPGLFPAMVVLILAGILLGSLWVPNAVPQARAGQGGEGGFLAQLLRPGVPAFFLCVALMQLSHGPYYTFLTLHLERLGYERGFIGQMWALGVVAEIVLFLFMARILTRFSVRWVLAASFLLAALRWLLLGNLADHLGVLLFAQLLHAATFGSFHAAAIHFVQRSFGPNQQGQGQALYAALAGTGGALGALYAGYSWESLGAAWTFAIASLVALAAAIIIALRLHEERA